MLVTTPADLGNVVRERRAELGLTQAQLAERAGTSRLWVNQVEAGNNGASLLKVLKLLGALDLALDVGQKPRSRLSAMFHGSGTLGLGSPAGTAGSVERGRGPSSAGGQNRDSDDTEGG